MKWRWMIAKWVKEWRDEQREADQMEDFSTKQEQNDNKIRLQI